MDILTSCLFCGILLLLIVATVTISALRRYVDYGVDPAVLDTFRTRLRAWWILFGALACFFVFGQRATTFFFFLLSIGVLREYITLTPKSPVDHQTLFWIYVLFTPLQFLLVGVDPTWFESVTGLTPYQVFSVLLPGYVFLVLPGFMAVSGDPKRFLERTAKLQLGLIVCVYAMSYAPALLTMGPVEPAMPPAVSELEAEINGSMLDNTAPMTGQLAGETVGSQGGPYFRLLFFFVIIVQFGDVFQYLWSQISHRHVVAPNINATKTWEGLLGGAVTTALLGVSLWFMTPFPKWWQAGLIALITSLIGFAGNMTMSAIKRDRGVSGYGSLIHGHSGLLDRIDSLCFSAPIFYHLAWLFSR